jgi:CspA family cold shock protein
MPTGAIKSWFEDRGFGFIRLDDGSPDVFAHMREVLVDVDGFARGTRVMFEIGTNARTGQPEAKSVRLECSNEEASLTRGSGRPLCGAKSMPPRTQT